MATVKLSTAQSKAIFYIQARIQKYGFCHRHAPSAFGNIKNGTIQRLVALGLIEMDLHHINFTPAGLAYLYQDAPMVDQPQPAPTPYQPMNVTLDLTTVDPINHPVRTVESEGVAIPRRCNIDTKAAHQLVADAQALNAKIAAEAAVIRNSK